MHLLENHVDRESVKKDQVGNQDAVDETWNLVIIAAAKEVHEHHNPWPQSREASKPKGQPHVGRAVWRVHALHPEGVKPSMRGVQNKHRREA